MDSAKGWQDRNAIQKLIDGASLCDRDERGKVVPWKDASGAGVSVALLKPVLNALLTFYPNIHPSEALIAARAGRGLRSVQRAISVLQAKDLLLVEDANPSRGGKANKYTILVTKLAQLQIKQGSLWRQPQRATVAGAMRHQEQSNAPPRAEQRATGGAQRTTPRTREDQTKQGRAKEMLRAGKGEVLRLAHEVRDATGELNQAEADEVIGICILRADGKISENAWAISLRSTAKAKPRDGLAYWKTCVRNQLAEVGEDLEDLMLGGVFQ